MPSRASGADRAATAVRARTLTASLSKGEEGAWGGPFGRGPLTGAPDRDALSHRGSADAARELVWRRIRVLKPTNMHVWPAEAP